jgi:hypothetical protein
MNDPFDPHLSRDPLRRRRAPTSSVSRATKAKKRRSRTKAVTEYVSGLVLVETELWGIKSQEPLYFEATLGSGLTPGPVAVPEATLVAAAPAERPKRFQVGKFHTCRYVADADLVHVFQIVDRSAKTVTVEHEGRRSRRRIEVDAAGVESCRPLGRYGKCPRRIFASGARDNPD